LPTSECSSSLQFLTTWITDQCRLLERESAKKKASRGEPNFVKLTTDGTWRLILTTGDVKTQNALGGAKLNYVPIKAMQEINPDKTISTGIVW
jgi:hypothetical protein